MKNISLFISTIALLFTSAICAQKQSPKAGDTVDINLWKVSVPYYKLKKIWFGFEGSLSYGEWTDEDALINNDSSYYFRIHRFGRLIFEGLKDRSGELNGEVKFYRRNGKPEHTEF